MDAYTIAFGLRNCTHIDKVLKEAHRVLKKGNKDSTEGVTQSIPINFQSNPIQFNPIQSISITFSANNLSQIQSNSINTSQFHNQILINFQSISSDIDSGGRFLCLEFSHIEGLGLPTPLVQSLYDLYSFTVIPQLGEVLAGDRASYQYLVESIRRFPTQQKLMFMMQEAGFQYVSYKNLSLGIVAIHSGFKL